MISNVLFNQQSQYFFMYWYRDVSFILTLLTIGSGVALLFNADQINGWLIENWGYGTVGFITSITFTACIYGIIQSIRGKMVVFIDDELTPSENDVGIGFIVLFGIPCLIFLILFLITVIIPPLDSSEIFLVGILLTLLMWITYFLVQIIRSYYYNTNAANAFIAVVLKAFLTIFTALFIVAAISSITDRNKSWGNRILGATGNAVGAWATFSFMKSLIYSGPSLRSIYK